MRLTQTHTYAELDVSKAAFDEIATKLRNAGYDDVFLDGGDTIDMHGIALVVSQPPPPILVVHGKAR